MSDKRKPGQVRNKNAAEREEQLDQVAKYTRRGYTQYEIGQLVGISTQQVCYDQKIIRARWREHAIGEYDDLVREKVEQLKEVRREAWKAWERSKEDWERVVEEHGLESEDNGDAQVTIGLLKRIVTKAGRLPDNAYLVTILNTLKEEGRLTGLGQDVDRDGNKPPVVVIDFGTAVREARKLNPPGEDPVQKRLAEVEALPDKKPASSNNGANGQHKGRK